MTEYRCEICGVKFPTVDDAVDHVTADEDRGGHDLIDLLITRVGSGEKASIKKIGRSLGREIESE